MVNKSKARGTAWETAVVRFLQANGFLKARRKVQTGSLDEADVAVDDGNVFCAELKDCARISLSEFIDEAVAEAKNAHSKWGLVIIKRRNRGVGEAYATMRLSDWTEMAHELETLRRDQEVAA